MIALSNSKLEDAENNKHIHNQHYLGFDQRDVEEYNLTEIVNEEKVLDYVSLSSICTHGIVGECCIWCLNMECDHCDIMYG